jgi:hypothetical protein
MLPNIITYINIKAISNHIVYICIFISVLQQFNKNRKFGVLEKVGGKKHFCYISAYIMREGKTIVHLPFIYIFSLNCHVTNHIPPGIQPNINYLETIFSGKLEIWFPQNEFGD